MKIRINGKELVLNEGAVTVAELIKEKNLKPENIVVEYNSQILDRNKWTEVCLKQDDNIEIVSFVGGG